jgi:hypothetical protein
MQKTDKLLGQLRLDLEHLQGGLQTYAAELGAIDAEQAQVAAVLADLKALNDRQEQLKAETEAITRQLGEKMTAGRELVSRTRLLVKAKLGPKSEKLEAFGITVKR